jgi:hypothetical protein
MATLPAAPNPISLNDVTLAFGRASGSSIAMNDIYLRATFGDWFSPISMENGRGKTWIPTYSPVFSTAGERSLTVPAGATYVGIKAWGGGGGSGGRGTGTGNHSGTGGAGGFMWGVYECVPGETLYTNVGGGGARGTAAGVAPYAGEGGGGGGATWVRYWSRADQPFLCIVGGGGGGAGAGSGTNDSGGPGGGGGGSSGVAGWNNAAAVGAGGAGASGGSPGAGGVGTSGTGTAGGFLTGGNGSTTSSSVPAGGIGGGGKGGNNGNEGGGGGGGGSGWYGGGGGGWSANAGGGGGGGGSNYFAGHALLYSLAGQTGSINQVSFTYPNFGGPDYSSFALGGYGVNTSGAEGITGFDGALALFYFTT